MNKKIELKNEFEVKDDKLQINFWLNGPHEKQMLEKVAKHNERSMSSQLRHLIIREYKVIQNGNTDV